MEFKEVRKKAWNLVAKRNMIPLAIGIIIGGAFSMLVNSLADDVINLWLAKAFGYKQLRYMSSETTVWEKLFVYKKGIIGPVTIKGMPLNGNMYGKFLSALVSFFVVNLFLFSFVFISYLVARRFVASKAKEKTISIEKLILKELKSINQKINYGFISYFIQFIFIYLWLNDNKCFKQTNNSIIEYIYYKKRIYKIKKIKVFKN